MNQKSANKKAGPIVKRSKAVEGLASANHAPGSRVLSEKLQQLAIDLIDEDR